MLNLIDNFDEETMYLQFQMQLTSKCYFARANCISQFLVV